MKLLDRLQRRFGRFALPRVTEGLICCQVLTYLFCLAEPTYLERVALIPERVLQGELWRLVTFLCQSPPLQPIWAFFFWCLFYMMGTALEATWGAFRYNVYLLVGWAVTVAVSFLQPQAAASISFLQASVFLAFAFLYPNYQLLLFFVVPVKVKFLAFLQCVGYLMLISSGNVMVQLMVMASLANFALFFWQDILLRMKEGQRSMVAPKAEEVRRVDKPRHTCAVCGKTNVSDPKMSFRYCSKCAGAPCYCEEHIRTHEHVTAEAFELNAGVIIAEMAG